jgi:release factor glutamine methyltransferase
VGVKGKFVVTDLFSNIKGKYNVIAFNAPFLASGGLDSGRTNPATDGGISGREVLDRFLENYRKYVLKDHMVFISESWWNHFEDDIKQFHAKIAAKKHYPLLGDCVILKLK